MTCPTNPILPDDRINLQPTLIDFDTTVGTTGQAHDEFPKPGQARYDWMRSYLIGLLSNQSAFCEPIEFRLGTMWFDLNVSSFKYRAGTTQPIINTEGDNFISIAHGIELETGLSLQQWFLQIQALITPPDPDVASLFSKLTRATASEAISAGSLVYVSGDRKVGLADQTNPDKSEVIGVTTVSAGMNVGTIVQHVGLASVLMEPGLTVIAGQRLWLGTAGRGTNIEPLVGVFRECGIIFDSTIYDPSDPNPTVLAIILPAGTESSSSATLSMPAEVFVAGGFGVAATSIVYKTTTINQCAQATAANIALCNTVLGVARNSAIPGATVLVDRFGGLNVTAEPSVSIITGDILWLSALVAGAVTNVAPTGAGQVAFVLGYAKQGTAVPGGGLVMSWAPRTPTINP